jgi:hypothetical protein
MVSKPDIVKKRTKQTCPEIMRVQRTEAEKKTNGIHYTPPILAAYLAVASASGLRIGSEVKRTLEVLDPACGEGELLMAVVEAVSPVLRRKLVLTGFDTDAAAVERARVLLAKCGVAAVEIHCGDFLAAIAENGVRQQMDLSFGEQTGANGRWVQRFDLVISNPPYVRTQVLGATAAQKLAERFALSGRVDLYHAFVRGMTLALREGGVLGLLTSNRFLSVQSGASVRSWLAGHFQLLRLVDLGDTKLFHAAVLPAIVVGLRKTGVEEQDCEFIRVYEDRGNKGQSARDVESVLEVLDFSFSGVARAGGVCFNVQTGRLHAAAGGETPWAMSNQKIDSWLATVKQHSEGVFSDVGKVCVGIKSTADVVFVRDDWECLPESERPEEELLHPLVTHHLAKRWNLPAGEAKGKRVLYPYKMGSQNREPIELADYPRAEAYLLKHAERLKGRNYVIEAGRRWYEIWVPQRPSDWACQKIAFPDISESNKFFLVDEGWIVNGDCYWIRPLLGKDENWLYLMLAVANSSFVLKFYDVVFHNKLYAGRRRFMSQYVSRFPLPRRNRAGEILGLMPMLLRAAARQDGLELSRLEIELDEAVWRAFGLAEEGAR